MSPPPDDCNAEEIPLPGSVDRFILLPSLALLFVGFVVRILLLRSNLGPPDADESVVLLMAKDMLHGHFETFFWGQEYGGTQEALLVAGLAGLGLPLRWAGEVATIGLSVVAAALVWRLVKASVGANVAVLAGALFWSAPIAYVWLSQKERGFYWSSVVSGLAALLFATRWVRGARTADAAGLGLAVGSAIWSSPQTLYLLVPLGLWLAGHLLRVRRWDRLRTVPVAAAAAVLAGAPWLWTNAHTGLASLQRPLTPLSTPGERLSLYWRLALPQVSGFKLPYDPTRWIGTRAFLVPHLGLVVLAVAGGVLLARKAPWVPLALAWHPVLFAALGTSFYVSEARYLFLLWPTAAFSLAYMAVRFGSRIGPAALALLLGSLTVLGGNRLIAFGTSKPGNFDLEILHASLVVTTMERLDVDVAFAEYWSSYPLEVASGGDIVASPLFTVRDPRRERTVRSASRVAYVLYSNGCAEQALNATAAARGQRAPERLESGGPFAVVVPEHPIQPEEVVRLWAAERGSTRPDLPDCST